CARKEETFDFW
nr:immunoglobulin heavy chain junction region [Macaca mulatta]